MMKHNGPELASVSHAVLPENFMLSELWLCDSSKVVYCTIIFKYKP